MAFRFWSLHACREGGVGVLVVDTFLQKCHTNLTLGKELFIKLTFCTDLEFDLSWIICESPFSRDANHPKET